MVQGGQQVVVNVRGVEDNFLQQVSSEELFFGPGQLVLDEIRAVVKKLVDEIVIVGAECRDLFQKLGTKSFIPIKKCLRKGMINIIGFHTDCFGIGLFCRGG